MQELKAITSGAVKSLLRETGNTRTWLAVQLEVSRPYISQICNGNDSIGMRTAMKISKIFGIKLSEFIERGESYAEGE